MLNEGHRRFVGLSLVVGMLAAWSFADTAGEAAKTPVALALPVVHSELGSLPVGSYVLAVDGRSSRTVVLDTASHTVHVFDRRGREDVTKTLQAAPDFSWDFLLAFAAADGGDVLALTTSGGIAIFKDFRLERIVSLDKPPSVAMDLAFDRGGGLLFSRMVLADPAMFGVNDTLTLLAGIDDDGAIENVAFPIEPKGTASYMRWTSQRELRIAPDEAGGVWVADAMAYRIRKLSPTGRVLETMEKPDERSEVETDPNFDPAEGHGTDLAGGGARPKPRGESITTRPVIRDIAAAGRYLWVLARDEKAPGGERLDLVLPGEQLERFSLPLPASMEHERFLGVTRRFVVLCPAENGHLVTLDRDEIERLAEDHFAHAAKSGQPTPGTSATPGAPAATPAPEATPRS